ncbi:ribosomal RNA methyltransferase FtsJ domain-containing protein [Catenaria anguillulae PL171]|uniref:rRNA methyltransferase 2, mitochondrial n=1 Tax=Catenaria anguillulae PL171 TaxID=765915 RepID=A0A1Y2I1Q1_9FUNG|nr:ribosomal RNA methyltransferase FtsJ domain-containing protein [Catenaria anguillulae PL171]
MGAGSKAWLNRHVKDHFVRQAREQGLQSRAAFKLKEIQAKHRILRPGSVVIDCGAAPGGWTQIATEIVRSPSQGLVIAVDLLPLRPPIPTALCLQQDFTDPATVQTIRTVLDRFQEQRRLRQLARQRPPKPRQDAGPTTISSNQSKSTTMPSSSETQQSLPPPPPPRRIVDAVLCDMAPSFSGTKAIDRLRTVALAESALVFAEEVLRPGGSFVCKVLQGPETDQLRQRMNAHFKSVMYEKPKSSRSESAEGFLVALGFGQRDMAATGQRSDVEADGGRQ